MGEPCYGMLANDAIAFFDVGPIRVGSQVYEDAVCAVISTFGQYDVITFVEGVARTRLFIY
jgi:hypothetical protein